MSKPWVHAKSSAKKFGGKPEDYIEIHNLMDSSKAAICDNRHRALTHNSWFLFILEKIFGVYITNSAGNQISVRDIGEQHISEDFKNKFIPTPQDYLENMALMPWMNNAESGYPSSTASIIVKKKEAAKSIEVSEPEAIPLSDLLNDPKDDSSNDTVLNEVLKNKTYD